MADIREQLKVEIESKRKDIAVLLAQIDAFEKALEAANLTGDEIRIISADQKTNGNGRPITKAAFGAAKWGKSVQDALADILRKAGRPTKVSELMKELNDMDIYPQESTIERSMRKDPERFERVDIKTWNLRKRKI